MLPFAGPQKWRLADGRALADISLLTEPEESSALIMKDGRNYKNTIQ